MRHCDLQYAREGSLAQLEPRGLTIGRWKLGALSESNLLYARAARLIPDAKWPYLPGAAAAPRLYASVIAAAHYANNRKPPSGARKGGKKGKQSAGEGQLYEAQYIRGAEAERRGARLFRALGGAHLGARPSPRGQALPDSTGVKLRTDKPRFGRTRKTPEAEMKLRDN